LENFQDFGWNLVGSCFLGWGFWWVLFQYKPIPLHPHLLPFSSSSHNTSKNHSFNHPFLFFWLLPHPTVFNPLSSNGDGRSRVAVSCVGRWWQHHRQETHREAPQNLFLPRCFLSGHGKIHIFFLGSCFPCCLIRTTLFFSMAVTTVDSGSKALEFLGLRENQNTNPSTPSVSPNYNRHQVCCYFLFWLECFNFNFNFNLINLNYFSHRSVSEIVLEFYVCRRWRWILW